MLCLWRKDDYNQGNLIINSIFESNKERIILDIAIVEDTREHAEVLKEYCAKFSCKEKIQINLRTYDSGVSFLNDDKQKYDLIFLDIDLPKINGMDVAIDIRKNDSATIIVFITNLAQYAISGYKVDALDYIIKPVSYFDFSIMMKKAIRKIKEVDDFLIVKTKDGLRKIFHSNIVYLETVKHYIALHTVQGEEVLFRESLKDVERELDDDLFVRCNSCYIVNISHVNAVENNDVILPSGQILSISRSRKKQMMGKINSWINGIK